MRLTSVGPALATFGVLSPTVVPSADPSSSSGTAWLSRMTLGPPDDVLPLPDPTYGEHCFRLREVGVGVEQLVDALNRDAENLRHFWHAHEILCHVGNLANT